MNRFPLVEWWKSATQFLNEVKSELKNVSWPSRREVEGTTGVVIVAVFVFGIYLWFVDVVITMGIRWIFDLFKVA